MSPFACLQCGFSVNAMDLLETKPSTHPLFDPESVYSRMRRSVRPEYKMRGYFHWQKARALRLGAPHSNGTPTDVIGIRPLCLVGGTWIDNRASGSIVLAHDAGGAQTVGMSLKFDDWEGRRTVSCRAFLIEPEVLARLQEVVETICGVARDQVLLQASAAETIVGSMDVARLLSAIPDLDGEVRGHEIHFYRLPITAEFDTFPPRQEPLMVVVVFDDCDPATGNER